MEYKEIDKDWFEKNYNENTQTLATGKAFLEVFRELVESPLYMYLFNTDSFGRPTFISMGPTRILNEEGKPYGLTLTSSRYLLTLMWRESNIPRFELDFAYDWRDIEPQFPDVYFDDWYVRSLQKDKKLDSESPRVSFDKIHATIRSTTRIELPRWSIEDRRLEVITNHVYERLRQKIVELRTSTDR